MYAYGGIEPAAAYRVITLLISKFDRSRRKKKKKEKKKEKKKKKRRNRKIYEQIFDLLGVGT